MAQATHTLNIIIRVTDKATKRVKAVKKEIKTMGERVTNVTQSVGKFQRALQGVLLGVGLSFLFTGMAIKKFFEGILKSLTSTFLTVMGETSAQVQQVNRLKAAWEFLKFRIMSTLQASGLWDIVIEKIQNIIDRTTEWIEKNPEATKDLVVWAAKAAIVGTIMMVLGQVLLGILGVATLIWGVFQLIAFLISGTMLAAISGLLLGLLGVLAIALLLRDKFGSWGNVLKEVGNTLVRVILFPLNLVMTIMVRIIDLAATAARAMGKTGLAADLNSAAADVERLVQSIDELATFELDETVIPDTTRAGLLDLVGLDGLSGLLEGTGSPNQDNSQTNTVNEFTININGSDMSPEEVQALLDELTGQSGATEGSPQSG